LGAFASRNSGALQRAAQPEALDTHDLLHPRSSFLDPAAGGPLEAPPNEPGRGCHLPRQSRQRFTVFGVEQAKHFIAAISGHKYEFLFALAITTGMRQSEYPTSEPCSL
jgi:integrase